MKRTIFALGLLIAVSAADAMGAKEEPGRTSDSLVVAETDETVVCLDAEGKTVTLPKHPMRAVVNYASFVDPWYFAGGTAVGIPDAREEAELPEAARAAASTGRSTAPNVERVLALAPDLLIVPANIEKQRALADIARQDGIAVVSLRYETYADFIGIMDLFFRLNGKRLEDDPEAMSIGAAVDRTVEASRRLGSPRFLSLFVSARSVQAETNRAHTACMAAMLGGANVADRFAAAGNQTRIPLSAERIVMEDPEVIFVTTMGDPRALRTKMEAEYFSTEPWKSMKAVRNARVVYLPDRLFLYKPNRRFPEAFALLAEALHPAGAVR